MSEYTYSAFISYRHTPLDEAVAKKLHSLLENYSVPRDIQKATGIRKLRRVFRDQEELPLSADLGADIHTALEGSEWLIVLCSPRYLESRWCNAEIDYFISLGRRDHILALLLDGEPEESFPQQLRYAVVNGKTVEVEPLAGDVRAKDEAAALRKLKDEKLRLLAPMLGVGYDQLRQRARRRKRRIAVSVTAACFALLAGLLGYTLKKNAEVRVERDRALNNQMQLLIEQANIHADGGDKLLAVDNLVEAAEVRETIGTGNDGAYQTALEYALYNGSFDTVLTLDTENRKFTSLKFSHNDRYLLAITNLNSACLIDADTGKILYSVSRSNLGQLDFIGFTEDDKYFYMVDSWYGFVSLYETQTGKLYREYDGSGQYSWNIAGKVFPMRENRILIVKEKTLVLWDYEKDSVREFLPCAENMLDSYIRPLIVSLSPDESSVVIGSHGGSFGMKIIAIDGTKETSLERDAEGGCMNLMYSGDGRYVCATSGVSYFVWNTSNGRMVQSGTISSQYTGAESVLINYDGSVLLCMSSGVLRAIRVSDGETLWEKEGDSHTGTEAFLSPNGRYVCTNGGISGVFDLKTGEMLCDQGGTVFSSDSTKVLCGTYSSNPRLLVTPEGSTQRRVPNYSGELYEAERYTEPKETVFIECSHSSGDFYSPQSNPANAYRQSLLYTSPDVRYAAQTHYDGFIEIFDISDPKKPKDLYCLAEHCYDSVTDVVFSGDLMASCGGYDPRCVIFDLRDGQILHVLPAQEYLFGCEFSKDGSKIILLCGFERRTALVYSVQTGSLLYRLEAPQGEIKTQIEQVGFTSDGTQAAAILYDKSAIVGELYPTVDDLILEAFKR